MNYKTICFQFLEQRPELYEQLCRQHRLLATMEQMAAQLKASHEAWKELLSKARPGSDASQIGMEAMELALEKMEEDLPSESPTDEHTPLSLEAAMAFIRRHTHPA